MKNLQIVIDGQNIDLDGSSDDVVVVNYELEDPEAFQNKQSNTAFDVNVPTTLGNDKQFNSFHNPQVEDLTTDEYFRNPRNAAIIAGGDEIISGKAVLKSATHSSKPNEYAINIYGGNGDWLLQLQELTLWDIVPTATHVFDGPTLEHSWLMNPYAGDDYVYAPARYKEGFRELNGIADSAITPWELRPSLNIYWMVQRAFASIGYTVAGEFIQTPYFQYMVLPWVWGNFLEIGSAADLLKFRATGSPVAQPPTVPIGSFSPIPGNPAYSYPTTGATTFYAHIGNCWGSNKLASDVSTTLTPGYGINPGMMVPYQSAFDMANNYAAPGFDNNANYTYDPSSGEMKWTYKGIDFGTIKAHFGISMSALTEENFNAESHIQVKVYVNGTYQYYHELFKSGGGEPNPDQDDERVYNFVVPGLVFGDSVSIIFDVSYNSGWAPAYYANADIFSNGWYPVEDTDKNVVNYVNRRTTWELFGIELDLGGTVNFKNYEKFKNYKFLDMLRGLIDCFNLQPVTDSVSKRVYFNPSHQYTVHDQVGTPSTIDGYFQDRYIDWTEKQDLSKKSVVTSFSDAKRKQIFKFKDDSSDGGMLTLTNRYNITPASAKYIYSSRFLDDKEEIENRFFSSSVHYFVQQWHTITGVTPQLMCIIPENIANTSADEAESEFNPKIAWYNGFVNDRGGWKWQKDPDDPTTTLDLISLPYMFAVDYHPGGELKPVLSYSDEQIPTSYDGSTGPMVAAGLMRAFFLQRLAIRNYGKLYQTWMHLTNRDVSNYLHREKIIIRGGTYLLIGINSYNPITDDTTSCTLWKYWPMSQKDLDNSFPSTYSVLNSANSIGNISNNVILPNAFDTRYVQLILIPTDLQVNPEA